MVQEPDSVGLVEAVDRDYVGMIEGRDGLGLPFETVAAAGVRRECQRRIFRATLRCSSQSSARKTSPIPPAPIFSRIL